MGSAFGPREKAIFSQTLAPLLKGLEGSHIVAELKNDIIVQGKLIAVDCFMNLTMENAGMTRADGTIMTFEFFFLQNKNLRYVRIPDHVSIRRTLKEQVDIVTGEKAREDRRKAKEKRANFLKKRQQKNMAKEVQEAFSKKDELDSKKDELDSKKDELDSKKEELDSKKEELGSKKDELGSKMDELGSKKDELGSKNQPGE